MPNVKVTFIAPDFWNFDPDELPMHRPGDIVFVRAGSNPSWTFEGGEVKNGGSQFSRGTVSAGGAALVIHNAHTSLGRWDYWVRVRDSAGSHTSPDPQIINEPQMSSSLVADLAGYVAVGVGSALVGAATALAVASDQGLAGDRVLAVVAGAVLGAIAAALLGFAIARGRRLPR